MAELPPMPDIRPDSDGGADLHRWKEKWREFRNAAVDALTDLLDESDTPDIAAARLQSLGERLGSDPDRNWNEIIGTDDAAVTYRIDDDETKTIRLTRRGDAWWFENKEQPTDQKTNTDIHRSLALKMVSDLFFW